MAKLTLGVGGMSCGGCVLSVEKAIGRVPGVKVVRVDLARGRAEVEGDDLDGERIRAAVEDAGYEVPESPTPG